MDGTEESSEINTSGKLILVCGLSGAGKSTLIKEAIKQYPDKLEYMKSYTTRPRRDGEDDSEYFFVNSREFMDAASKSSLWEQSLTYDNLYGQDVSYFLERIAIGRFVIGCCRPTLEEVESLYGYYPKNQIHSIYLATSPEIAAERVTSRRSASELARLATDATWSPGPEFEVSVSQIYQPFQDIDEDKRQFTTLIGKIINPGGENGI